MTNGEKLIEVTTKLKELRKIEAQLLAEKKALEELVANERPYVYTGKAAFKGKKGNIVCVYWNIKNQTFYTKPIVNADGTLVGAGNTKSFVEWKIKALNVHGFKEVE